MDDEFQLLVDSLDIMRKNFTEGTFTVQWDVWLQCEKAIANIRKDSETFVILQEFYLENYRDYLRAFLTNFWNNFETNANLFKANPYAHHRYIFMAIQNLYLPIGNWINNQFLKSMLDSGGGRLPNFQHKLYQILYTAFIADMPLTFSSFLYNTFEFSFKVLDSICVNNEKRIVSNSENQICSTCKFKRTTPKQSSACFCTTLDVGFNKFLNHLRKMGIFHQLCDDIIKSVLYNAIEKHIFDLCKDKNFDHSCLGLACSWFENNAIDWIRLVYIVRDDKYISMTQALSHKNDGDDDDDDNDNEMNDDQVKQTPSDNDKIEPLLKNRFHLGKSNLKFFKQIKNLDLNSIRNFLTNTYIYCRMKQLFDIIIDYPYSEPALIDLHECIKFEPFYREKFTNSLRQALKIRLLHAGVPTCDIIEAYITTIKALKLLDPQGIILQVVCDPVRNYLRTREDTVRCIITILTQDSLLNFENSRNDTTLKDNLNEDEFIFETWKSWIPQTYCSTKMSKEMINSDIISMLINIFDSKDLFVQEYQRLLAQKMILSPEINLESELRNLEILSLRFGESDLHNCRIMLKDFQDSSRINNRLHSEESGKILSKDFQLNTFILSEQFWPENLGFTANELKNFKLPEEVAKSFESYRKAFEEIKPNRTLNWINQLGTVKLEIEFKNRTNEYTCRPIQAAIIYLFGGQKVWKISSLVQELNVPPSMLRRNLFYWKNLGVLQESEEADCFEINEDGPPPPPPTITSSNNKHHPNRSSLSNQQDLDMFGMDEEEVNVETKNENNLEIFWNFIDNMLRNLQALPLDRIYSMLKVFHGQSQAITNLTMHELRQYLEIKVLEKKLIFSDGHYDLSPESESWIQ